MKEKTIGTYAASIRIDDAANRGEITEKECNRIYSLITQYFSLLKIVQQIKQKRERLVISNLVRHDYYQKLDISTTIPRELKSYVRNILKAKCSEYNRPVAAEYRTEKTAFKLKCSREAKEKYKKETENE